jgi:hypothetical protein
VCAATLALSWDKNAAADRWRALRTVAEQRRTARDLRRYELRMRGRMTVTDSE